MSANRPVSALLILDDDPAYAQAVKGCCEEHNLVALLMPREGAWCR
jgi:hypothetical protein